MVSILHDHIIFLVGCFIMLSDWSSVRMPSDLPLWYSMDGKEHDYKSWIQEVVVEEVVKLLKCQKTSRMIHATCGIWHGMKLSLLQNCMNVAFARKGGEKETSSSIISMACSSSKILAVCWCSLPFAPSNMQSPLKTYSNYRLDSQIQGISFSTWSSLCLNQNTKQVYSCLDAAEKITRIK